MNHTILSCIISKYNKHFTYDDNFIMSNFIKKTNLIQHSKFKILSQYYNGELFAYNLLDDNNNLFSPFFIQHTNNSSLSQQLISKLNPKQRFFQYVLYYFYHYQRTLNAINKFKQLYKIKYKYKVYDIDTDINLTPLTEFKKNHIISLIENDTIYKFSVFDLVKIIKNSLFSNKYMNNVVRTPRNPYTNSSFSYHNLYNMYFHILNYTNIHLPYYIHSYFQNGVKNNIFLYNNHFILRINAVKEYIDNEDDNNLLIQDIKDMFYTILEYEPDNIIEVESIDNMNKADTIEKCKVMLKYFLSIQMFNTNSSERSYVINSLIDEFYKFREKYPAFARKKIRFVMNNEYNRRTVVAETIM